MLGSADNATALWPVQDMINSGQWAGEDTYSALFSFANFVPCHEGLVSCLLRDLLFSAAKSVVIKPVKMYPYLCGQFEVYLQLLLRIEPENVI